MEFINKREFMITVLNETTKRFVVYITILLATPLALIMQVDPFWQVQVGLLLVDKAPIKVFSKYFNYADVFLFNFAMELLENTGINKYAIKLIDRKQPLYGPIYALSSLKLEILKTHIETLLKT